VAEMLGLDDPDEGLLKAGSDRWPGWQARHPVLRVVGELRDLRDWLLDAEPDRADAVLLALAELAAADGGDDLPAAGALCWVLLPGASRVANQLAPMDPHIDDLVAGQLWVEARSFRWRHGHRVAANILWDTRIGVLRDIGVGKYAERTWRERVPMAPASPLWRHVDARDAGRSAAQELAEVLVWACDRGAITADDGDLLLQLAYAADQVPTLRLGCGQHGLMAPAANRVVAARWGVSTRTVRRRALSTVRALAAACSGGESSTRISA
jgi:hypothetical protein